MTAKRRKTDPERRRDGCQVTPVCQRVGTSCPPSYRLNMVNSERILKPTATRRLLLIGGILLIVGLIGILRYALEGTNTPVEGDVPADAVWQSATIIGGAFFTGIGVVLIVIALIKRHRMPQDHSGR
jgi:hypothetical protein